MNKGIVNIRGKEYKTVALRVDEFRNSEYRSHSIETQIISSGIDSAFVVVKATIKDDSGRIIATGLAEEEWGSTNINKTSALENCETSAIGRALACLGFGGQEYASANEVSDAIVNQAIKGAKEDAIKFYCGYMATVRNYIDELYTFKSCVANDNLDEAVCSWLDIPKEERRKISKLAPSKGGFLTTEERAYIDKNQKQFSEPDEAE